MGKSAKTQKKNIDPEVVDPEVAEGNTDLRHLYVRAYAFTINNYTQEELEIPLYLPCTYICWSQEVSFKGTPHIQGYVYFQNKARGHTVKKMLGGRAHIETARGTPEQNRVYIKGPYEKDDKIKPENPTFQEAGQLPRQGTRTDLKAVAKKVQSCKKLRDLEFDDEVLPVICKYPKFVHQYRIWSLEKRAEYMYNNHIWPVVHVRWGTAGSGKTREVYQHGCENVYKCIPTTNSLWFCGYDGQDHLLIDEFNGQIKPEMFFQYIDIYPVQLPIKGGHVWRTCTDIWITSQVEPDAWWPWLSPDQREALHRRLTDVKQVTRHRPAADTAALAP